MSCSSSSSPSPGPSEHDSIDPLDINDSDKKQFEENLKRGAEDDSDTCTKKPKLEVNESNESTELDESIESEEKDETSDESALTEDAEADEAPEPEEQKEEDESDTKSDKDAAQSDQEAEDLSEPSKEPNKKEKKKEKEQNERKVQNLRKNIKDVIDDSQLDETTLAAQRQESERLARLQEQQRLVRENQRQMAAEKFANKTQLKVLSLLQGDPLAPSASSDLDFNDPIMEKLNLGSSISLPPAAKEALQSIQSLISTDDNIPDSDGDSDDDVVMHIPAKPKPVVIDSSSSDSDDCIILSDEEEEEVEDDDEGNSGEHTNDVYNQKDAEGRVVVNMGHNENEENIYVAPQIARIIKPHQIGGVRFLFDNIIESANLFDKSAGFGCLLAHSMGLGKTLQLVCFCDIFLRHTKSKTVLVIMPINTLQNWLHEFNMWLPLPEDVDKSPLKKDGEVRPRHFNIFVLNDSQKTLTARAKTVLDWSSQGGVLMMGYEMYRLLSLKKIKKKKGKESLFNDAKEMMSKDDEQQYGEICHALINPGPDLVVCDEGHRIKNAHATTSLALKQIKTKRRVVLTGYPLQNNLLEYWCMVDFVRPNYLGTKTEFSNMFERPIQNGQCLDSTPQDCKLMRYRAHVLHSLLKGFVQRRSQTVLQKTLPVKTEFVMLFRMTAFQRKLYSVFMDEVVRSKKVPNPLKAFSVCCKIWNHPDVLHNFLKKRELDLDLELEENESVGKSDATNGPKKRGRKAKGTKKDVKKELSVEKVDNSDESKSQSEPSKSGMSPIKLTDPFQPAAVNEFKYESSSSSSFNSYQGYQNYDSQNYNAANRYQNYSGSNYWQNNYYPSEYNQEYSQQSTYPPYYNNSSYQKPPTNDLMDVKPKIGAPNGNGASDGGLLADVIKEEAKGLQESKDLKSEYDKKMATFAKSAREDGIPYEWAVELMKDYIPDLLENSPKIEVFFTILNESIKLGDRLLVFSQSLLTLNLLERFLQKNKIPKTDVNWARNVSYFRLDGTTAALEREKLINEFNSNDKVKLFLVSTRAGSLGINLVGANRVIVFDASWNPCHDTQAVCRVYRYGQSKSCYVYRFVMDNCLEKKIYDRQINKQGMADRIVDECNPDAHLSMREVTSLCYDDGDDPELKDFSSEVEKYEDLVTKIILKTNSKALTKEPFQHESLLVDRKEKKLSQAEKRLAQRGYELEKQAATKPQAQLGYNLVGTNYRAYRTPDGSIIHRPVVPSRPEPKDFSEPTNFVRPTTQRPNRWVPVEVWQSKGLQAQEMTLPQDVSIQTNSADKSKIYLKAGQKVIVLKSPKGICLQLESGKVIAIRASMKNMPNTPGAEQSLDSFATQQNIPRPNEFRPRVPVQGADDIIDISNDDDDDVKTPSTSTAIHSAINPLEELVKAAEPPLEPSFKDKTVYKPNLVKRKPKIFSPPSASSALPLPKQLEQSQPLRPFDVKFQSQKKTSPLQWDSMKNYSHPVAHKTNSNGDHKGVHFDPIVNAPEYPLKSSIPHEGSRMGLSAFQPTSNDALAYGSQYPAQNMYNNYSNYQPAAPSSSYNYPYHNYSNPPSYHYPETGNFDPNLSSFHGGYNSVNYNPIPPEHPLPINPEAPIQVTHNSPPSNVSQWNYNS